MIGEETVIQIFGREMKVEIEGLTPIEVAGVAQQVTEKMQEIQKHSGVADSSKLAMLACLHFAVELQQVRERLANVQRVDERKIDTMIRTLQESLSQSSRTKEAPAPGRRPGTLEAPEARGEARDALSQSSRTKEAPKARDALHE